jgi:hypothetical protein
MKVELLPRHTWRWWLRPPVQRQTLGRSRQYAQGIRWSIRLGPLTVTRFAACTC